jgi:GAG-pre-integrase domain
VLYACKIAYNDAENEGAGEPTVTMSPSATHHNQPIVTAESSNNPLKNTTIQKATLYENSEPMRNDPLKLDLDGNIFNDTAQTRESILDSIYIDTASPEDLMLLLHCRFGHVSMQRIRRMAERGILPKKLLQYQSLICQACIYGKMTRRPWRTKPNANKVKTVPITRPGMVVSVDQLESPVPGFVAQMKGKLTR